MDDPPVPVAGRVIQRKAKRGKGLAPAGRHREGEQAGGHVGLGPNMGKDVGAQPVQPGRGVEPGHMRVETRLQIGQQLLQPGPVAVARAPLERVIKRLCVAEIGIDQTGKHHPHRDRQVEPGLAPVPAHPGGQLCRDRAEIGGQMGRPLRVEHRPRPADPLPQTAVVRAGVGVGQPRMVAEDRLRQGLGRELRAARGRVKQHPPARGGVIDDRPRRAPQHPVEGGIVFAQIVQPPGQRRRRTKAQRHAPCAGQPFDRLQMIGQALPVGPVVARSRMGIMGHLGPCSLRPWRPAPISHPAGIRLKPPGAADPAPTGRA